MPAFASFRLLLLAGILVSITAVVASGCSVNSSETSVMTEDASGPSPDGIQSMAIRVCSKSTSEIERDGGTPSDSDIQRCQDKMEADLGRCLNPRAVTDCIMASSGSAGRRCFPEVCEPK